MAHALYENFILENKLTDLLNTKLDTKALMTIDTTLTTAAGLKKIINKYTYTGSVEKLAKGAKNAAGSKGAVSFTPSEYEVERFQHTFVYNDLDAMQDPMVVDVAMKGTADLIANDINSKYFTELAKIANTFEYTTFSYDSIVDAVATVNQEIEEGMFVVIGTDLKAALRKDPDFKKVNGSEIILKGQIGEVMGLPVVCSKLVPAGSAYITTIEAITFFVKKDVEVEQAHDIETKDNTVVAERHGFIALIDETKSVKMTKKAA